MKEDLKIVGQIKKIGWWNRGENKKPPQWSGFLQVLPKQLADALDYPIVGEDVSIARLSAMFSSVVGLARR